MSGSGGRWLRFFVQFKLFPTSSICNKSAQRSSFCTSAKNNNNNKDIITDERYQQLENLDMITAAKILFTDPPKKKKFGFDFHLVQFFFACMPSLAVYLVAQYARNEIRRMEGEVEEKKKKKEEEEAKEREKELELNPPEENEAKSDAQLSEVKERLDKLEEIVKEIAVVTKKQSSSNIDTNQVTGEAKEPQNISAPSNTSGGKDNSLKSKPELDEESKGSVVTPNSSLQDTTGQNQSEKSS
ncbi:protein PXR1-like [Trifolium pratense]|uniref:protein PXR1-like n=1 Tax=Trifolium pratense TaxID=57577 RepID=UPI001E695229|nr:protein PXR1-like [Trifolium pratense]